MRGPAGWQAGGSAVRERRGDGVPIAGRPPAPEAVAVGNASLPGLGYSLIGRRLSGVLGPVGTAVPVRPAGLPRPGPQDRPAEAGDRRRHRRSRVRAIRRTADRLGRSFGARGRQLCRHPGGVVELPRRRCSLEWSRRDRRSCATGSVRRRPRGVRPLRRATRPGRRPGSRPRALASDSPNRCRPCAGCRIRSGLATVGPVPDGRGHDVAAGGDWYRGRRRQGRRPEAQAGRAARGPLPQAKQTVRARVVRKADPATELDRVRDLVSSGRYCATPA